jgi:hypothetical protein
MPLRILTFLLPPRAFNLDTFTFRPVLPIWAGLVRAMVS